MYALIVLNFSGIFCFGSLLIDCTIEVAIFMIDWTFYRQSIILQMLIRKGREETRNVLAMIE